MTTEESAPNSNPTDVSSLEKKIIRQIEYYFGDHNLPRDRFLQEKITEDDGWVTVECLTTFNRLKMLSSDQGVIAAAVQKSNNEIVEVSEDGKKIRRLPTNPLPDDDDENKQKEKERIIYCKGFPDDYSLEKLEEYFEDKGQIEHIFMRRGEGRKFKGSVFIKFKTVDGAKEFLAQDSLKCGDTELIRKTREDFYKEKAEKYGGEKDDSQKIKKEKERKEEKETQDLEGEVEYESGLVISFKNVGEQTSREDVKELFTEEVAWVDFQRGDNEGFIRFNSSAAKALETIKKDEDGQIKLRGVETSMRILEGDEEKSYWVKVQEDKAKARNKRGQGMKRKKNFLQRNRGRDWRNKRGGEPPAKVKKEDNS